MANYVTNWVPVKDSINTRRVVLFVEFDLANQDVETRQITDATANANATAAFNIVGGGINGKIWKKAEIFLSTPHSQLPANHTTTVQTYESDVKQDDDSMDTGSTPTW